MDSHGNLHLSWCFEIILVRLIVSSDLFSNLSNTKMLTLPTLCTGKLKYPNNLHLVANQIYSYSLRGTLTIALVNSRIDTNLGFF